MIPKRIHFVWVGTSPKSELILRCIDSWKKFCSDYEIVEWDNAATEQVIKSTKNPYLKEAFEQKKWAFVSDFIRLYALKKFGGFYFDSDLEVTANIDKFRKNKFISGYEKNIIGQCFPFTAFVGSEPDGKIISALLADYDGEHFINSEGSLNLKTNTVRVSEFFAQYGVKQPYNGSERLLLGNDGVIEPSWFFCTPETGKENYTIHHFNGSWLDGYKRKNKFKIGNLYLVRFRKIRDSNSIPLNANERILIKIHTTQKCIYAIVRKK